jgi:hypothetical protein
MPYGWLVLAVDGLDPSISTKPWNGCFARGVRWGKGLRGRSLQVEVVLEESPLTN